MGSNPAGRASKTTGCSDAARFSLGDCYPIATLGTYVLEGKDVRNDILDRLRIDPGKRTLGELMQDREAAASEIARLRAELERLPSEPAPRRSRPAPVVSRATEIDSSSAPFRPESLIRLTELCRHLGISRSTVYKRLTEGTFPRPVRLGPSTVRWSVDAIKE